VELESIQRRSASYEFVTSVPSRSHCPHVIGGDSLPFPQSRGWSTSHESPVSQADFRGLYEHFLPFVGRWVTRLGIPSHAIEDVVQEIFLTVYSKLDQFEGRASLRSWMFGVTIRVTRNYRRKRTTGRAGEEDAIGDAVAGGTAHPEAAAAQTEALTLLQQILNGLDDDRREVFVLAELEELSAAEIATLLEISSNTVASRLRLAREEVRAAWARAQARDEWRLR